jgi:predicted component of type VI protein secretion system
MMNKYARMAYTPEDLLMDKRTLRWTALALSCLLVAGCKDKHEPLKPTVARLAVTVPAAAA